MHHSMLPLIISCTRSWNFAWHLLWRATSESKNIVELLAIGQTIHIPCVAMTIIFQRANLNYLIVCFTQCTLFFPRKFVFYCRFVAVGYLWVVRNKPRINLVLWHSVRQTFASLGLFTFARIACLLQLWIKTRGLDYSIWATPK